MNYKQKDIWTSLSTVENDEVYRMMDYKRWCEAWWENDYLADFVSQWDLSREYVTTQNLKNVAKFQWMK